MKLCIFLIMIFPITAYCGDYEECIADKMKEAHSNYSAKLLADVCYKLTLPKDCRGERLLKYKKILQDKKTEKNKYLIAEHYHRIEKLRSEEKYFTKKEGESSLDAFLRSPSIKISNEEFSLKALTEVIDSEVMEYCKKVCENSSYYSRTFGDCSNDW